MTFNQPQFQQVVETARMKAAGHTRWLAAIDKAVSGLNGGWIVTELADGIMVTTESGNTYHANGVCQCKAFKNNQPCKHRAAARLVEIYREAEAGQVASRPATRPSLVARIFNRVALALRNFWTAIR